MMFNPNLGDNLNKIVHELTITYIRNNPPVGLGNTTAPLIYANAYKTIFEQIKQNLSNS